MKPSWFFKPHSGMNKSDSFITNEKQTEFMSSLIQMKTINEELIIIYG